MEFNCYLFIYFYLFWFVFWLQPHAEDVLHHLLLQRGHHHEADWEQVHVILEDTMTNQTHYLRKPFGSAHKDEDDDKDST